MSEKLIPMDDRGVRLTTFEDAYRFAVAVAKSDLAPKGMNSPEKILVALQTGAELGLTPMRALSSVVVVNGRASLMGDAALALVRQAGAIQPGTNFRETIEGEGVAMVATVTSHRKGDAQPVTHTFSAQDAKRAGLWGKSGPWSQYPQRMLKYRARGFHLRDLYSDVLMGLMIFEEARDVPKAPKTVTAEPPPQTDPLLIAAKAPALAGTPDSTDEGGGNFETPTVEVEAELPPIPEHVQPTAEERLKTLMDESERYHDPDEESPAKSGSSDRHPMLDI